MSIYVISYILGKYSQVHLLKIKGGKIMSFHKENDFNWEGIEKVDYKTASTDGPISFNKTDRHTLVGDGQNTSFHTRYFECDGGGYSSLEKHAHVHVVIAARGKGVVIVDDEVYEVKPHDLIVIPPWAKHQLVNASETEPFGFFCIVDADRDRFQTLTREEVAEMQKNEKVAKAIRVHEKYWG